MTKWAFLWITDLHFASPDTNYIDDPKELNLPRDEVFRDSVVRDFNTILDFDFRSILRPGVTEPLSFIAIGGDITTRGRDLGFDVFSKTTYPKLRRLVSTPEAICIVPGNHDVTWGLNPTSEGYFNNKFAPYLNCLRDSGATTCLIPTGHLNAKAAEQEEELKFEAPGPGPIYWDKDKKVLVLTLNSSIRCGELNLDMASDFYPRPANGSPLAEKSPEQVAASIRLDDFKKDIRHHFLRDVAHVTQAQLRKLGAELDAVKRKIKDDFDKYLRVALIHHHLTTYPGQIPEHKGYEATVDSSAVLDFLTSHDFDLVLSGHKHQPYVLPYRFNDREIVFLGGATVAGGAPSESFRGFHLVEVALKHRRRSVYVSDIPYSIAGKDIEREIKKRFPDKPNATLLGPLAKVDFRYRDVVSVTRIRHDGDTHRIVDCDGLMISQRCERRKNHVIQLPRTAGYLGKLRARASRSDLHVDIKKGIPEDQAVKSAVVELRFQPELSLTQDNISPESYRYEWFEMNAVALDKLQYARKYGTAKALEYNTEFTHFVPADPIEVLTVIVQFPEKLKLPYPPFLRITDVSKENEDPRSWVVNEEESEELTGLRALRYFESLNIAALRVRDPKPNLSYGIQWTLPEAPEAAPPGTVDAFKTRLAGASDETLKRIYRVLEFSREPILLDWKRGLDGTLMIFTLEESGGFLKAVGAGFSSGPAAADGSVQKLKRENEITLEYGEGIAGRAFKANAIRIYLDPSLIGPRIEDGDHSRYEPNFYKFIPGVTPHKGLIAFPVHLPVADEEFEADPNIYRTREPYGVLNIGSELADLPVAQFLLPERTPVLLPFQHRINKILAEGYQ